MDEEDRPVISILWCIVYRKYEGRIWGQKNFSTAWINGSANHKTSNITDHACSEQHKSAMALFCKDQAKSKHKYTLSYGVFCLWQ